VLYKLLINCCADVDLLLSEPLLERMRNCCADAILLLFEPLLERMRNCCAGADLLLSEPLLERMRNCCAGADLLLYEPCEGVECYPYPASLCHHQRLARVTSVSPQQVREGGEVCFSQVSSAVVHVAIMQVLDHLTGESLRGKAWRSVSNTSSKASWLNGSMCFPPTMRTMDVLTYVLCTS